MKRIYTLIIVCCLLMVTLGNSLAQNAKLRYADKQFELFNLMDAARGYQNAFDKRASYRAAKGAAKSYQLLSSYQEAYNWWKITVDFEESVPDDFNNYIFSIYQAGKLDEVKTALKEASPEWKLPKGNINMDSLLAWYSKPVNIELQSMAALNSPSADYGITFDQNGNTYFSSDRGKVSPSEKKSIRVDGSNKFDTERYDMTGRDFIAIYKGNGKDQVQAIQSVVPNTFHIADPFLMKGKSILFYTLTRDLGEERNKRNINIYPEIFFSRMNEKAELLDYKPFSINSAMEYGVINPYVDEEEMKVYFSSNKPGGKGGYDLYYVSYDEEFNFGPAVNLGPAINTAGDERDPLRFEESFYFSSNGHIGLGGMDIFHSDYKKGNFSNTRNMGYPFNSPQDDFSMHTNDGEVYLSSNRESNIGMDDIYKIEDLFTQFVGKVKNSDGKPIGEGLVVELKQKDNLLHIRTEQKEMGTVRASVAPETNYYLVLHKKGYFTLLDSGLTTKGFKGDRLEKEYIMNEIPYNHIVSKDLIYYNYGQSQLREDTEHSMKKIATLMKDHSFLEIMVRSHTDSRSSNQFNEELSERRANVVRDYLQKHGIARSRVKSEWFGEDKLANDCGDGVPCPESSHQLNRRSELILVAFPDENKEYEFPEEIEDIDLSELGDSNYSREGR